jgi:hypothetical protein
LKIYYQIKTLEAVLPEFFSKTTKIFLTEGSFLNGFSRLREKLAPPPKVGASASVGFGFSRAYARVGAYERVGAYGSFKKLPSVKCIYIHTYVHTYVLPYLHMYIET